MNKERIRTTLYILTAIASIVMWIFSITVTRILREQEKSNINLWINAMQEIGSQDLTDNISSLTFSIVENNITIPAILISKKDSSVVTYINIDSSNAVSENYLKREIQKMKKAHREIDIDKYHILYYNDSPIIKKLELYPIIQLVVTIIVIIFTITSIKINNKAAQSTILVGMSKETAHQLGTPISSLLAWVEMLKLDNQNSELTAEVEKDVMRLVQITDRFSRIGNTPELKLENINKILSQSINYLKSRTSSNVVYNTEIPQDNEIIIPLCVPLFEWVIENLCKNAIDAMQGKGKIDIKLVETNKFVEIYIKDYGKGISKKNFKNVFKPGFTTKKHGWGLGLSLAQRIINDYHKGKIIVLNSEPNKGTTFKISLPNQKTI